MSDEVKPEVIKQTQDSLSKYFKSPPLTEKLLRKPPFRFLHDIISAVIRETGFLQGLFSEEELNSDNVKDKESKVAYLTKLIEVVKLATGDSITARPNKIVAGQEPTKTNELLQSIGKALDGKVDSQPAIEKYIKNKSKPKSDKDESKKSSKKSLSKKKSTENESSVERRSSISDKKKSSENGSAVERRSSISDKKKSSENEKVENSSQEKEKETENLVNEKPEKPSSSKSKKPLASKPEPENVSKSSTKPAGRKSIVDVPDSIKKLKSSSSKDSASMKKRKPMRSQSSESTQETDNSEKKQILTEVDIAKSTENGELKEKKNDVNNKTEIKKQRSVEDAKESSLKVVEESAAEKMNDPVETFTPAEKNTSNEIVRPKTSLRPPSARPPSARPAAPKMKTKTDFIINEEIISSTGNVNVIVESFDAKDDNADDMVVMEAPQDPMKLQDIDKIDSQFSQEHGHLVAQILETQKELINTESADVLPKKVEIEWEAGLKRDRESTVKEIDKMRSTIQTLTRTTNPLRKLLDFVQEDVEIMQKELQDWQFQYEKFSKELEVEQTKTEESIEPMKESLEELKSHIKTQLNKIGQVKLNIMKNDQKIQRLLNGNF